jgi:hypothetical protein
MTVMLTSQLTAWVTAYALRKRENALSPPALISGTRSD